VPWNISFSSVGFPSDANVALVLFEFCVLDVFDFEDSLFEFLFRIFDGHRQVGQLGLLVDDLKCVFRIELFVREKVKSDEKEVSVRVFWRNGDGVLKDGADEIVFGFLR
jgi:hypothetical protein